MAISSGYEEWRSSGVADGSYDSVPAHAEAGVLEFFATDFRRSTGLTRWLQSFEQMQGIQRWRGEPRSLASLGTTSFVTHRCFFIYSATPVSANNVSNIRFRPRSRPVQSNHSCKVWAPPP